MQPHHINRQLTDIQAQAERLILHCSNLEEIKNFSKYNEEIRSFLYENIKDEFILDYAKKIPSLNLNEISTQPNNLIQLLAVVFSFITAGSVLTFYNSEKRKIAQAQEKIKEIKNKYNAADFMLKNYFAE